MQPEYGIHLGMVINNTDPENRKRVQVFIPYLSNTIFEKWNNSMVYELKDITFKNPNDLGKDLVDKLKAVLPWAEAGAPLFGGSTTMAANTNTGAVGVNNTADPSQFVKSDSKNTTSYKGEPVPANTVGTGLTDAKDGTLAPSSSPTLSPSEQDTQGKNTEATYLFDSRSNALDQQKIKEQQQKEKQQNTTTSSTTTNSSATTKPPSNVPTGMNFSETAVALEANIDPRNSEASKVPNSLYSAEGTPNTTISIPNPGAKVWVFFYGGDLQRPVYFAAAIEGTT